MKKPNKRNENKYLDHQRSRLFWLTHGWQILTLLAEKNFHWEISWQQCLSFWKKPNKRNENKYLDHQRSRLFWLTHGWQILTLLAEKNFHGEISWQQCLSFWQPSLEIYHWSKILPWLINKHIRITKLKKIRVNANFHR